MQLSITQSQGHNLRNDFISVQILWSIFTQTKQAVTSLGVMQSMGPQSYRLSAVNPNVCGMQQQLI